MARRPVSFIATSEPEVAKVFYSEVIGLKLLEASPYALAFADHDTMLRVQIVENFVAVPYTVHGWQVTNIEDEVDDLVSKGVVFSQFEHLPQDDAGIWTTPDGHKIAWFRDPGGNILSLTEYVVT